MGVAWRFCLVEVFRILDEIPNGSEEGHEDGGVAVPVVPSADARHHVRHFDFVRLLVDDSAFLNHTRAQEAHCVDDWTERCRRRLVPHHAHIRQDQVPKGLRLQAHRRNTDSQSRADVGQSKSERLSNEGRQVVC